MSGCDKMISGSLSRSVAVSHQSVSRSSRKSSATRVSKYYNNVRVRACVFGFVFVFVYVCMETGK